MISQEKIYEVLRGLNYPGFDKDIITLGILKDVSVQDSDVTVILDLRTQDENMRKQIETMISQSVSGIDGVRKVEVQMAGQQSAQQAPGPAAYLSGARYKFAVASGKGGVGKSTVSVNLAVAMAKLGLKVGLLYSDIYGPSIPLMLGVHDRPEFDGEKLVPIEGQPPDLLAVPKGCAFRPRCTYAIEKCREETPVLAQVAENHEAACWVNVK